MNKKDIDSIRLLIDDLARKHGLAIETTNPCIKISGSSRSQKMYVFKNMSRIDTTLPIAGKPGTIKLSAPNGAITCHITPDPKFLKRYIPMLADDQQNAFTYAAKKLKLDEHELKHRLLQNIGKVLDKTTLARIEGQLQKVARILDRNERGFMYKRIWIERTTVRAHKREGHFVLRQVRGK